MKIIIIVLNIFISRTLLAQFGVPTQIKPIPSSTRAEFGIPSLDYFNYFGSKYLEIYTIKNNVNNGFYKSYFKIKNNLVKVKTVSSFYWFPRNRRFKIIDKEILKCDRFGRIIKNRHFNRFGHEIINSDSIIYQWDYYISKNDTLISMSYRSTFSLDGKIKKYEVAWNYYAYNDSTWLLAESSSSWGGVQRTSYNHVSDLEKIITIDRITSKANSREVKTINYEYDSLERLVQVSELNNITNRTFKYKYVTLP